MGIRSKLSYANLVATLALFIALGGGATAAVLITGDQIAPQTITKRNLATNSVTGKKIKKGTISRSDLNRKLRSQLGATGGHGAAGPAGPAGPGFPTQEAHGGPFPDYVSMTPVVPLTANSGGVYVIRAGLDVTNTEVVDRNAFCVVVRLSDNQVVAGGFSPGAVPQGQTVRVSFAGVDEVSAGDTVAVGCQTDGTFDLANVDLLLVKLAG